MISDLKLPKIKDKQFIKENTNENNEFKIKENNIALNDLNTSKIRTNKLQKILKNITDIKDQENNHKNNPLPYGKPLNNQKRTRSYLDVNLDDSDSEIFGIGNKFMGISADGCLNLDTTMKKDEHNHSMNYKSVSKIDDTKQNGKKTQKITKSRLLQSIKGNNGNGNSDMLSNKKISKAKFIENSSQVLDPIFKSQNSLDTSNINKDTLENTASSKTIKPQKLNETGYDLQNKQVNEMLSIRNSRKSNFDIDKTKKQILKNTFMTASTKSNVNNLDFQQHQSKQEESKTMINVEMLIKVDEKLYGIIENEKNVDIVKNLCKEYMEIIETQKLLDIDKLFPDIKMNRMIKNYFILERISILLIYDMCNNQPPVLNGSNGLNQLDGSLIQNGSYRYYLSNIIKYVYNNYLNYIQIIANRASPVFQNNKWLEKLRQCKNKINLENQEKNLLMPQLNEIITRLLKLWIKITNTKNDYNEELENILEKIDIIPFDSTLNQIKEYFNKNLASSNEKLKPTKKLEKDCPTKNTNKFSTSNLNLIAEPCITNTKSSQDLKKSSHSNENILEKTNSFHLPPLQQDTEQRSSYTLILDLDETLIHYEEFGNKGRFLVRPYTETFLKEMSEYYELIVFTAAVQDYADTVLNILDKNGYIKHRLYRHHAVHKPMNNTFIKDLSKLGRDLKKTIIIDNSPENFRLQIDNGIHIKSWFSDPFDKELLDLMPFLKDIVINQEDDVRKSIRNFKNNLPKK